MNPNALFTVAMMTTLGGSALVKFGYPSGHLIWICGGIMMVAIVFREM